MITKKEMMIHFVLFVLAGLSLMFLVLCGASVIDWEWWWIPLLILVVLLHILSDMFFEEKIRRADKFFKADHKKTVAELKKMTDHLGPVTTATLTRSELKAELTGIYLDLKKILEGDKYDNN